MEVVIRDEKWEGNAGKVMAPKHREGIKGAQCTFPSCLQIICRHYMELIAFKVYSYPSKKKNPAIYYQSIFPIMKRIIARKLILIHISDMLYSA